MHKSPGQWTAIVRGKGRTRWRRKQRISRLSQTPPNEHHERAPFSVPRTPIQSLNPPQRNSPFSRTLKLRQALHHTCNKRRKLSPFLTVTSSLPSTKIPPTESDPTSKSELYTELHKPGVTHHKKKITTSTPPPHSNLIASSPHSTPTRLLISSTRTSNLCKSCKLLHKALT